jgi:hypothetical protein
MNKVLDHIITLNAYAKNIKELGITEDISFEYVNQFAYAELVEIKNKLKEKQIEVAFVGKSTMKVYCNYCTILIYQK